MTDLLDYIRIALSEGATTEQKQAGAAACCAIYSALSPPPGVPLTVPHAQPRVGLDQALDLAIAKLRSMLPADAEIATTSLHFPFAVSRSARAARALQLPSGERRGVDVPNSGGRSRRPRGRRRERAATRCARGRATAQRVARDGVPRDAQPNDPRRRRAAGSPRE